MAPIIYNQCLLAFRCIINMGHGLRCLTFDGASVGNEDEDC